MTAMRYRRLGKTGWKVSEVGCGLGGLQPSWEGWDDPEGEAALRTVLELGCTFFDTARIYGDGHSERVLGAVLADLDADVVVATKVSPDEPWPTKRGDELDVMYPPGFLRHSTERSLENLGVEAIDLMQFHTWEDAWAGDDRWQSEVRDLKDEGLVKAWGISVNRWEPWNVVETLGTGLIDTVQVSFNLFDQSPADELFDLCSELDVGVIARSPFDEGSLTGALSAESTWPEGDWRNHYFGERLPMVLERVAGIRAEAPETPLAELALRFILSHPAVSTVIPGMRTLRHVRSNVAAGGAGPLPEELLARLRSHRWDRIDPPVGF